VGWAVGGEMAQTMYTHMNKWINSKLINKISLKQKENKLQEKRRQVIREYHWMGCTQSNP
jgi:hypothetical protein